MSEIAKKKDKDIKISFIDWGNVIKKLESLRGEAKDFLLSAINSNDEK